ncbi:UDP-N-acetylmuramate--L-alanine ligase [Thermotoga sp. KOL6]|uniref:UDP-N-acetylmuramate--L-alanine ligase n=1 Tax=Thermotoga sp. KOL6 TaxID=126741 RepID=UPI000C78E82B|nr:UDP-N-acetylmuramate--L-alanine ligase [Thermotoga sp. KOL6]PLV58986.1 UDP-N-acetylmuramate--alanine ligase [Thermotoga sp. KOL6]
MKLHFVGIGGIGMSALALHEFLRGEKIYGSNIEETERTTYLKKLGIPIFIPHSDENWFDPDVVIKTPAVREDNPEIVRAKKEKVPVENRLSYFKLILERENKKEFAVTGTDGKTTTTAMIAYVLDYLNESPTVFLGGLMNTLEHGNYQRGNGPVVYELDESEETFSKFSPSYLIITNARGDHLENYGHSILRYKKAFEKISSQSELVITFAEDELTSHLGNVTFGVRKGMYTLEMRSASRSEQRAIVEKKGKRFLELKLKVPGFHNILNALAVVALFDTLGYDLSKVQEALEKFPGVYRRFSISFHDPEKNVYVIDDYAHTPEEIKNLLRTAKEIFENERIVVVFQPHRYSRLEREDGNFAKALQLADEIIVTEVYDAFEERKNGISGKIVWESLKSLGKETTFIEDLSNLEKTIPIKDNTVFLFVGAGDIVYFSKKFIESYQISKSSPSRVSGSKR